MPKNFLKLGQNNPEAQTKKKMQEMIGFFTLEDEENVKKLLLQALKTHLQITSK